MVKDQASEGGITVELKGVEGLPLIRLNARMLRQIILNLLSNAIKFTPKGGGIKIDMRLDEPLRSVSLRVKDTGIGIAPADINKVMRPFEQVESVQGSVHRGTGLGLPMAKFLVELLGGEFTIQSEIGNGTTVTMLLPVDRK